MRSSGLFTGLVVRAPLIFSILIGAPVAGATGTPAHPDNPHYTAVGFFDMHVCDWPEQPTFFMGLFSTTKFKALKSVEITRPDGQVLGRLNLNLFRLRKATKERPEKRVFITHFRIPAGAKSGWYTGRITMKDGRQYVGRDYVILAVMPRAKGFRPADGAQDVPMPRSLSWDRVPGAAYYRVFIRDLWSGKLIYTSSFLRRPKLILPKGLIQSGGDYSWRVHARDVNGHVLLGDFNDGSLSKSVTFTVAGGSN